MKYDVVIVGAGPMGIYTAYEFMAKNPNLKVLLIDKGHDIYHRNCPILEKKIKQCPKDIYGKTGCKPACSMTSGFEVNSVLSNPHLMLLIISSFVGLYLAFINSFRTFFSLFLTARAFLSSAFSTLVVAKNDTS